VRHWPDLRRRPPTRHDRATAAGTWVGEPVFRPGAKPPQPTSARPDEQQLALWASQIEAGKRKMTVATDGCRVTWNRSCKHGHPSWLVYLDYLSP
jgi:hypothetical protein